MISRSHISLRDAEESDTHLILKWENDPLNWEVSEREQAYSLEEIQALMESSSDYFDTRQKRWIILVNENTAPIGTVDVFQGNLANDEVGVGILIADEHNRRKGFAQEAIRLALEKCSDELNIRKAYAVVHSSNEASLKLFEKCGFEKDNSIEENSNFDQLSKPTIKFSICLKK